MSAEQNPRISDKTRAKQQGAAGSFLDQLTGQLDHWLKENNPEMHSTVEYTLESVAQIANQGLESARASLGLIAEFVQDLIGVESFQVIPKSSLALEVDIRCRQEQDIVVKQMLAPFVELHALHLGKRISFEALVNRTRKGLQLDINEGMSLKVAAPLLGMQTIEIKGSGLLMRDTSGQLVLVARTKVPGLDSPIEVAVPMKHLINEVQTQIKRKLSRE